MRFLKFLLTIAVCGSAFAQQQASAPFSSASISGLGARNIGSAAMSGRISAIAGAREPSGKITLFVGAASGGDLEIGRSRHALSPGVRRTSGSIHRRDHA